MLPLPDAIISDLKKKKKKAGLNEISVKLNIVLSCPDSGWEIYRITCNIYIPISATTLPPLLQPLRVGSGEEGEMMAESVPLGCREL